MLKKSYMNFFIWLFFLFIISSKCFSLTLIFLDRQDILTEIIVEVVDQEGNPIPGITVILISRATGITKTTITSGFGIIRFKNLTPGSYNIRAERPGFRTKVKENINVSYGIPTSITLIFEIDELGGLPPEEEEKEEEKRKGKERQEQQKRKQKKPRIYKITLPENLGIIPIIEKETPVDKIVLYYFEKKIFAKYGIAEVGFKKERLNNITEIPFGDQNYIKNGINMKEKCVYAIRIGKKENKKMMLIRVLEILQDKIKIEYYIQY